MAGLLDYLNSGPGGGLLDFLRNGGLNQQMNAAGLPEDQAQYGLPFAQAYSRPMDAMAMQPAAPQRNPQPSPLDNAQWPAGPVGAPSQAFAQMPPQQRAPQGYAPPEQPGILDRVNSGLQSIGNGGSIIGAITGNQTDPVSQGRQLLNQTAQYLESKGIDPALAKTVVSDPALLRSVLPQIMGIGGQTDDIKEYQFAKREDPTLTFEKFMARKKSVTGEYGLTPIWGTGPDGKPAYIQPGKSGDARLANLPKGFEIARDPIKVDAGTHFVLLDPQTRQPVGTVPKNIQEKEAAEERGKVQGQAQAELPAIEMNAKRTISQIDEFMKSKGFNEVFGGLDQFRPTWTMSDNGREALSRFKQLSGRAFLEGRSMLKGGGAITDFESNKAESAIARLERSLNETDAKTALEDFKEAVRDGAAKLKAKAGGGAPAAAPTAAASTDLKKKYGLD